LASLASPRRTNRLLDRLTEKDRGRVLARCEKVDLAFAEILDEPGEAMRYVFFPTSSFISQIASVGERSLKISLTGNEGLYGIPVALGTGISPVRAKVQGSGPALRMSTAAFRRALASIPALRTCIDRYSFVVMNQLVQTTGCNRFHLIEQRLSRWLLMIGDRAHSPTFRITHVVLAAMLGVRREGVTGSAFALQKRKLIEYRRGVVTIVDRKGLERASCSCYRLDLATYGRFFD
jgi:Crp-like helix-turn-helix domain